MTEGAKSLTEGQPPLPSESSSEVEKFLVLAKVLGSIPELLPVVSDSFLDASLIDLDTKKKVVQYGGWVGAQLLMDALYLKLEQSGDYEDLVLAIFGKVKDLKDVVDTAKQPPMKKPQLPFVPKVTHSSSPKLSPRSSPRRQISSKMSDHSDHTSSKTLHELLDSLLIDFTKLASESSIYLDRIKMKLGILLQYSYHSVLELDETLTGFKQCPSIDRAMKYLVEQNLLNCLNLQILKLFRIKGFEKRIQEYEASHQLFMSNKFETIAEAVQEISGKGTKVENGLPEMTIDLNHPWETKSYSQWQEVLQGIVDWTEFILIKNIQCSSNAVSITYAILPFMLMRIVKDIDDTNTFKRLNEVGASFTIHPDVMDRGRMEAELMKRGIESQLTAGIKLDNMSPDETSSTSSPGKTNMAQTDIATFPSGSKPLTPIHVDHKCQICHGLLNNPYQLLCCGSVICYSHISRITGRCPHCRETNFRLMKNHRIEKNINELPVECTANKECYWTGPLEDLEKHVCPKAKDIKEREEVEAYVLEISKKIVKVREGQKASYRMKKDQPAFKGIQAIAGGKMLYTISDVNYKKIDWRNIALAIPTQISPSQFHSSSNNYKPLQCAIRILSFRDGRDHEVCIIVTKNIESHIEQAIIKFKNHISSDYKVAVTDTLVLVRDTIEVKTNEESKDHMWLIEPKNSVCKIHRADIEEFNGSQGLPPWLCYYVMMKEPENCLSQLILHDFVFEGTRGNVCFKVKIRNPPFSQKQEQRVKSGPDYNSGPTNVCVSTETCYEGIDRQGEEVSSADLALLSDKLWDLQSDWEQFAHALPVPGYIIRGIKTSYLQTSPAWPMEKFQQMMEKWRMKGGNRTWRIIHTALTKVRKKDMADNVLKKYPNLDTNVPFDEDGYTSIMTDVLRDVITLWSLFGLQLGLSDSEIQEIKGEGFQPISALIDLLRQWIGLKGSNANIIDIIIACEKIGHGELAQQLKADSDMCHAFPVLVKLK